MSVLNEKNNHHNRGQKVIQKSIPQRTLIINQEWLKLRFNILCFLDKNPEGLKWPN